MLARTAAHLAEECERAHLDGLRGQQGQWLHAILDAQELKEIRRCLVRIQSNILQVVAHFGRHGLQAVGIANATLGAHDIAYREIWDGMPVREALPGQIGYWPATDAVVELRKEAGLAHAGLPYKAHDPPLPVLDLLQQVVQDGKFPLPPHKSTTWTYGKLRKIG